MRLIAQRQLYGSYGLAHRGDVINVEDRGARDLLRSGAAVEPAAYQTKIVAPPETKVKTPRTRTRRGSR